MGTITVKVLNEREVIAALRKAGDGARLVHRAAIIAAATVIEKEAESNAPGPHVSQEVVTDTGAKVEVHVGPDKAKWYYKFFERGTPAHAVKPKSKKAILVAGENMRAFAVAGGIKAQPFLRPAVDNKKDEASRAAGVVFKRGIE